MYAIRSYYGGYIVATLVLILLQGGLISFLLWQRAQRQRDQVKYRTVADFTYDWEYWANLDDSLVITSYSIHYTKLYEVNSKKKYAEKL